MPTYQSPGVYVEEVPSAIRGIAGVSTSTAGFIGIVPNELIQIARNPAVPSATKFVKFTVPTPAKTPVLITNWTEFTKAFGDLVGDETVAAATGDNLKIDDNHRNLAQAVYGFFANGGGRCFVVRVTGSSANDIEDGLNALDAIDEIALVAAPGQNADEVRDKIIEHCENLQDRFAILDGPQTASDLNKLALAHTTATGLAPRNSNYAAWYYPWVTVFDPAEKLLHPTGSGTVPVAPSGHIAGVYARVDATRGMFKSPANEVVRAALGLTHSLSRVQQEGLNVAGVNCIRDVNGNITVWGARTVGGDANNDLKYIATRRTLNFLRESIQQGLQWSVFEPNTPELWNRITFSVTSFLTAAWRAGALFGPTAEQSFFVKCDAENNPPSEREQGRVVTEVGVSIVRPAEFVIFRVSQSAPAI